MVPLYSVSRINDTPSGYRILFLTRLIGETMLQNINSAIDTFQGTKTQFVKTFVKNEELAKPLNTFIEAQTLYAKAVAVEVNKFFTTLGLSAYTFDAKKAFSKTK